MTTRTALLALLCCCACSTSTTDVPGDAGDAAAGDTLSGDPLSGDPLSGDPHAGDPLSGDRLAGDPLPGDANATCDLLCAPDPVYAMVECVTFSNGTVTVHLVRKTLYNICAGGCQMEPVTLWVQRPGRSDCFTDPGAMTYTNTHHNWNDSVSVCAADICYLLETQVDFPRTGGMVTNAVLTGSAPATSDVVFGPVDLPGTDRVVHLN